jgi:cell division septal protein FtsQ
MSSLALSMAGALGAVGVAGGSGFAGGTDTAGRVLDFRRRGAPPRRRRRNPLLVLARPLAVAATAVALPLALAAWVLTSPRFQLRHVEVLAARLAPAAAPVLPLPVAVPAPPVAVPAPPVAGPAAPAPPVPRAGAPPLPPAAAAPNTRRVPAAWVQQALAPLAGRNLLRLPLAEVRQRLAANPWIASVDIAKQLPDRLRVSIAERRPAVLLRSGQALLYADAGGRPIAPVESPAAAAARRQELLVVTLPAFFAGEAAGREGVGGALLLAARLRQLRPAWATGLSQIDVVDEDDFQLHASGLPCPLLVRGSQLAGNLDRFEQLLPDLRRRYPALAAVDLRFSRRIVIQPAPAAPSSAAPRPAPRAASGGPKDETRQQTPGNP